MMVLQKGQQFSSGTWILKGPMLQYMALYPRIHNSYLPVAPNRYSGLKDAGRAVAQTLHYNNRQCHQVYFVTEDINKLSVPSWDSHSSQQALPVALVGCSDPGQAALLYQYSWTSRTPSPDSLSNLLTHCL